MSEQTESKPASQPARRVVVAEDETLIRLDIIEILKGEGYDVVGEADNGEKAVQLAEELKPDLVLMDVKLPGLDGITLTRMLKSDPKTARIPVVALTAHAMKGDEQEALAAGCAAYITKPIEVAQFLRRITSFLEAGRP